MKRGWNDLHDRSSEGSEESYRLAQSLAAIADPEFIRSAIAVKSALDQWGGQAMVAAQRERLNLQGQRDPEGPLFATIGYVWHFKHYPDALKDALREPSPDSLEDVDEIPWDDTIDLSPEELAQHFPEWDDTNGAGPEEPVEPPEDPDEADRQADRDAEALTEPK